MKLNIIADIDTKNMSEEELFEFNCQCKKDCIYMIETFGDYMYANNLFLKILYDDNDCSLSEYYSDICDILVLNSTQIINTLKHQHDMIEPLSLDDCQFISLNVDKNDDKETINFYIDFLTKKEFDKLKNKDCKSLDK
jgi:hypothetical protein